MVSVPIASSPVLGSYLESADRWLDGPHRGVNRCLRIHTHEQKTQQCAGHLKIPVRADFPVIPLAQSPHEGTDAISKAFRESSDKIGVTTYARVPDACPQPSIAASQAGFMDAVSATTSAIQCA